MARTMSELWFIYGYISYIDISECSDISFAKTMRAVFYSLVPEEAAVVLLGVPGIVDLRHRV